MLILNGRVSDGLGTAAPWFVRYKDAYQKKTGLAVFPGTLNLRLDRQLSLLDPTFASQLILMPSREYGGPRDILMLPCILMNLDRIQAVIWRTDRAEQDASERTQL